MTEPAVSALADCLESRRAEILASYARELDRSGSPLVADHNAHSRVMAHAAETVDDMIAALRSGHEISDEGSSLLPRSIGASRAAYGVHPAESLRAAAELFKILTLAVAECVGLKEDAMTRAVLTLHGTMSLRTREAAASYNGFLLDKLHHAHSEERQTLARDLHDRVSAGITVAYRQLQLYEISCHKDPDVADQRVESAQHALVESMHEIRQLTAELRTTYQVDGLEKNLRNYIESVGADATAAEVIVRGDESWLVPDTRDEIFLTVREALRNALKHGQAEVILVRVEIAPHEVRATIDDNGVGFDPATAAAAGGTGIPSMKERIARLGGIIRFFSLPDGGTKVEIHIPLAGAHTAAETQAIREIPRSRESTGTAEPTAR